MPARSSIQKHPAQPKESPFDNSTRQRIIAGARHHFFSYGFRSVTMDDLAGELGMSKKTLYKHFPSKATLAQAVVLDKFSDVEADLERMTSECPSDFPAALRDLIASVQKHLEEIRPPFVRDVRREAPEMFHLVESRRRDLIQRYFGQILGEGQNAGILRKDIPTELIIEILLAAVQAIMNPEKLAELGLTPKAGLVAIIMVIVEGVITETGRSQL